MPAPKTEKPPLHTDAEKEALGAALTAARKAAGYSLDGVVAAIRERFGAVIVKAAVGHWHTGTNVPNALQLRWLTAIYGTSADAILGNAPAPVTWPFSRDLLAQVRALDAEEIHEIENAMWAALKVDAPPHVSAALSEARSRRAARHGMGVMTDQSQRPHTGRQSE